MSNTTAISYIRFSTASQALGDSYRRQIEAARNYCQKHGLTLDESIYLDSGVSGFTGKNLAEGALGCFIQKVKDGTIHSDVTLILESLDRLTRMEVEKALRLLLEIVDLGITVVTLMDNQVYRKGLNITQLMLSLFIMSRAHEESETKSKRLKAAWDKKKADVAKGLKVKQFTPSWLRKVEKNGLVTFEVIEDRANSIRALFNLMSKGYGPLPSIRHLNENGIVSHTGKPWAMTSVKRLINNGSVIGHYQPHVGKGAHRTPVGDLIKDYYPPVVDEGIYWKVYHQVMKTNNSKSGRNDNFNNIFSTMVRCDECGATMRYNDKGRPNEVYLVCSNKYSGRHDCNMPYMFYPHAEKIILMSLVKHGYQLVKPQVTVTPKELEALKGQLMKAQEGMDNLAEAIATLGINDSFKAKHDLLRSECDDLKAQIEKAERAQPELPPETQLEQLRQRITDSDARRTLHRILLQMGIKIVVGNGLIKVNEFTYTRIFDENSYPVWSGDDGLWIQFNDKRGKPRNRPKSKRAIEAELIEMT
ncbi:recombinase family protein [Shewanella submarina]|uniref:Recombinase family protein n=1 Tax=Shewanella submarina TaxID=2016376 RepID=A0ABV7GBC5_9GAMM|nr:recombinase family protein [Shewanella submarina]MCL1039472.1 recombinase family protein [Shewanella submarina]